QACFARCVGSSAHAPQAVKDDAGKRMDHRGEGRDRQNIAGDFNGALFCGAFYFFQTLWMGHRPDMPNVALDASCVSGEKCRELAIVIPCAGDSLLVDGAAGFIEEKRSRRDERLDAIHAHVALALLLGIVKGMCMEKGPHKLPADIFQAEFESCVLI